MAPKRRLGKRGVVSNGCVWRCPQCKTTKSICEGSFFTKSRMPLKKWLLLLHLWVRQYPAKNAAKEAEVDPNTACDIYRYFFGGLSLILRKERKAKGTVSFILCFCTYYSIITLAIDQTSSHSIFST